MSITSEVPYMRPTGASNLNIIGSDNGFSPGRPGGKASYREFRILEIAC